MTTRNYHIHFDKGLGRWAARERDLYGLARQLKLLPEVRMLEEIGFDDGRIRTFFARKR